MAQVVAFGFERVDVFIFYLPPSPPRRYHISHIAGINLVVADECVLKQHLTNRIGSSQFEPVDLQGTFMVTNGQKIRTSTNYRCLKLQHPYNPITLFE